MILKISHIAEVQALIEGAAELQNISSGARFQTIILRLLLDTNRLIDASIHGTTLLTQPVKDMLVKWCSSTMRQEVFQLGCLHPSHQCILG